MSFGLLRTGGKSQDLVMLAFLTNSKFARQCPVARGALTVNHILDQRELRARYAIGLLFVNEPFDREIHKDALTKNGRRNAHIAPLDEVYSELYGYKQYVVENRIKWMMRQGVSE